MRSPEWQLLDGSEIPQALSEAVAVAEERLALQAMHVVIDDVTRSILDTALLKARLERGFAEGAIFLPDAYSLHHLEGDTPPDRLDELQRYVKAWQAMGMRSRIGRDFGDGPLSRLRSVGPLKKTGRNHQKIYIADDTSFSFGGCNFADSNFNGRHDFLLRSDDYTVADYLYKLVEANYESDEPQPDRAEQFGSDDTILVDGGRRKRSLIMDVGIDIIRHAEPDSVHFMSQYRPSDELEAHLHRISPVMSVFNRSEKVEGPMRLQQLFEELRPPLPKITYPEAYTHAKCITAVMAQTIEVADGVRLQQGQAVALTGSHNFHRWGVTAGTAEIALLTTQEMVVDAINAWAVRSYFPDASEAVQA